MSLGAVLLGRDLLVSRVVECRGRAGGGSTNESGAVARWAPGGVMIVIPRAGKPMDYTILYR